EKLAYRWLCVFILLTCAWTARRSLREGGALAWLPVLWVLAFWSVHTIFEIQGRYFLGMYLLAPLWCALGLRHGRAGAADASTNASPAADQRLQAEQTGS